MAEEFLYQTQMALWTMISFFYVLEILSNYSEIMLV